MKYNEYRLSWERKNGRSKGERRYKEFRTLSGLLKALHKYKDYKMVNLRTEIREVEATPWEEYHGEL